jgi:hypothetical protein
LLECRFFGWQPESRSQEVTRLFKKECGFIASVRSLSA